MHTACVSLKQAYRMCQFEGLIASQACASLLVPLSRLHGLRTGSVSFSFRFLTPALEDLCLATPSGPWQGARALLPIQMPAATARCAGHCRGESTSTQPDHRVLEPIELATLCKLKQAAVVFILIQTDPALGLKCNERAAWHAPAWSAPEEGIIVVQRPCSSLCCSGDGACCVPRTRRLSHACRGEGHRQGALCCWARPRSFLCPRVPGHMTG